MGSDLNHTLDWDEPLTDAADTRNLITVALLTDKWKSWADQWRDTAFVQIQGFISPDGSERIYPEQPAF